MFSQLSKVILKVFGIVYSISGNFFVDSFIFFVIGIIGYNIAFPIVGTIRGVLGYNSALMSLVHSVYTFSLINF